MNETKPLSFSLILSPVAIFQCFVNPKAGNAWINLRTVGLKLVKDLQLFKTIEKNRRGSEYTYLPNCYPQLPSHFLTGEHPENSNSLKKNFTFLFEAMQFDTRLIIFVNWKREKNKKANEAMVFEHVGSKLNEMY